MMSTTIIIDALGRLNEAMQNGEEQKEKFLKLAKDNTPEFQKASKDFKAINRYCKLKKISGLQRTRCLQAIDDMCAYLDGVTGAA